MDGAQGRDRPAEEHFYLNWQGVRAYGGLSRSVRAGPGLFLLTGDRGTGKTVLARRLERALIASGHTVVHHDGALAFRKLIGSLARHLATDPATLPHKLDDSSGALREALVRQASRSDMTLIVDRAERLSSDALLKLSALLATPGSNAHSLRIVLVGRPELERLVAIRRLAPVRARLLARFRLDPLNERDSARYVLYRTASERDGDGSPFSSEAIDAIARLAKGLPQRIDLICERALASTCLAGEPAVTVAAVERAARVLGLDAASPELADEAPGGAERESPATQTLFAAAVTSLHSIGAAVDRALAAASSWKSRLDARGS